MALTHALLAALLEEEMSGYDLTRRFETSLGFFWQASHQQIYRELRRLEAAGLLAARTEPQSSRPDRVVYRMTDAGQQHLLDWVHEPSKRRAARDDLFVKLYTMGHADPAPVIEELRQRRDQHAERLALYERIRARRYADPASLPPRLKGIYLALSAGLRTEAMYVEWCDEALAVLGSMEHE